MNRVLAAAATFVLTVAGLTTFQTATALSDVYQFLLSFRYSFN